MSIVKRSVIILCMLFATVLLAVPAMAGWGAGWSSGSVNGSGTVTGLKNAQKNGATVIATIGGYGSAVSNNHFTTSGNIPGIVWCGNPGANNQVVRGVNPVTLDAFEG